MNQIEHSISISTQDLMLLGLGDVAYIKPVETDERTAYAVHAADGREIAVMFDRDLAFAAVRQNALEPLSVH